MLVKDNQTWWGDIIFLTLVLSGLFFILLGLRPLFVPDEGRYAEIAREMITSSDFVTPYLNGIKYFEKPILFYWLEAYAIKIGGLNLWAVRLPNACLALLGCLFTYITARLLYDRSTGLLSALILGTSTLYFIMGHMITLDLPVTFFLTCCLYFFLLGCHYPKNRRYLFWGSAASAALAVLTKGLIGIVFPFIIIGSWIILTRQLKLFKNAYLLSSLGIFLLIALPWHALVGARNPEFFYFYFIEQHFLRYINPEVGHYQPVWFFMPWLLIGFFPWIVFFLQALVSRFMLFLKNRSAYQTDFYFILWFSLIFVFFSLSKSKLIPYILPVFPAIAILTAKYLSTNLIAKKIRLGVKIGFFVFMLSAFCLAYVFLQLPTRIPMTDPHSAAIYLKLAAFILIAGSLMSCIYVYFSLKKALFTTLLTAALFLLSSLAALPAIDTRTTLPFAKKLAPILTPQDEVITYNQYYQDLPFYLKRRVLILNWRNELTYGMQFQDTKDWMINDEGFWQRFHGPKRIFVVMDAKRYEELLRTHPKEKFYLLEKTNNNVLITNHQVKF